MEIGRVSVMRLCKSKKRCVGKYQEKNIKKLKNSLKFKRIEKSTKKFVKNMTLIQRQLEVRENFIFISLQCWLVDLVCVGR